MVIKISSFDFPVVFLRMRNIFLDFFNSSYDLNAINNVSGFFYHGGIQLKPEKLKPASQLKSQPENDQ